MSAKLKRHELLAESFQRKYGAKPTLWVRAPGRVDLMGSHTDYNKGYALTLPIKWETWMSISPRKD